MTEVSRRSFLKRLAAVPIAAKLIEFDGGFDAVAERLPEHLPELPPLPEPELDLEPLRVWPEPENLGESHVPFKPPKGPGVSIFWKDEELLARVHPDDVGSAELVLMNEPVPDLQMASHMIEYVPQPSKVQLKLGLYEDDRSYYDGLWQARRDGRLWEGGKFTVVFEFEGGVQTRIRDAVLTSSYRQLSRNTPRTTMMVFECGSTVLVDWQVPMNQEEIES